MSQRKNKTSPKKDVDNPERRDENESANESKTFLPDRLYLDRDSLLTELFRINHFNSLLNMFVSFIILMLINTILNDWLNHGLFQHYHHISWVKESFAEPLRVTMYILILYFLTLSAFMLLKFWVAMKLKWKRLSIFLDFTTSIIYLAIIGCIVALPIWVDMNYYIPPCSSIFLVYEQLRMLMKIHAYARYVVPKIQTVLDTSAEKGQHQVTTDQILNWKSFLYFMIIPTLIYRESYPKRNSVDYGYALSCFLQFILCIIFMYYVFIHLLRPIFIDFDPSFMTKEKIIPMVFRAILPTILMMLTLFYCFLHLWLNTFAELTMFGDRQFYRDWWNATSLSDYLRTWNGLIHDWLYTYLYQDISLMMFKVTRNKKISKSLGMIIVILFSSLIHEYVLAFCFKFFYPVLLSVYFGSGTVLYFFKANRASRIPNIMLWTGLFLGDTIFVTLYSLEWYARKNCVRRIDGYLDFFVPRSLFCEIPNII